MKADPDNAAGMVDRRVQWEVIPDDISLHELTGVAAVDAWVAVAVPSIASASLVLSAVWQDGRVWAFIDRKKPVSPAMIVRSVKAFRALLRDAGSKTIYGLRDPKASVRWMEWLGAKKSDDVIKNQEVWVWNHG